MTDPLRSRLARALLGAAVTLAAAAAPVLAQVSTSAIDLLELPAVQSGNAASALLLDIAARGGDAFVAVGEYGVILVSEDGGERWAQAAVPASVMLTGVSFPTPDSGWAVGHDGLILHSSDGGLTWSKQLDGHRLSEQILPTAERIVARFEAELEALNRQETADEIQLEDAEFRLEEAEFMLEGAVDDTEAGPVRPLLDVWFRDASEGFVLGSYGMLLHTTDGGENWQLVSERLGNPQAFHLNQIAPAPDGALYIAAEAGLIFRSFDGGRQWDTLETGYDGSFYGVVVAPAADGGYELLAYGLRGNLFHSTDRGGTWEPLESGTSTTLTTGTLLRDGTVMLAGQGGTVLLRPPGASDFHDAASPDRRVISGVAQKADGSLLLVGLGGVRAADAAGAPLDHPAGKE
jgi:photosystem II stability/assembly factor-like uncharacterized protein